MNFFLLFQLLCSVPFLSQSLILHALFLFSCYARIPSTVYVICITSRSTLSFGVWPLTQSSYRSIQWTLSWRHKLPSSVHHGGPRSSRTLTVIWSPSWCTPAWLELLYCSWGSSGNLRTSSAANSVWPPWWFSLFLLCSLLSFCSSRCWTRVHTGHSVVGSHNALVLTPSYNPSLNSTSQIRVWTFSFVSFLQCLYPAVFSQNFIPLFLLLVSVPCFLLWAITALHGFPRCCYLCV